MVLNGTLMIKDRKGNIDNITLSEASKKYQTYQTLSMNYHGHEQYSFSLIEKIKTFNKKETQCFKITTENSLGHRRVVECTPETQVFTKGKRWSGFVSVDKVKKNSILIDDEDRVNKIVSIEKLTTDDTLFDVKVMYTGNYFYNGILVR